MLKSSSRISKVRIATSLEETRDHRRARTWARVIGRQLLLLGANPVQRPCSEPP